MSVHALQDPSLAQPAKAKDKKLVRLRSAAYFNKSFVHDEYSSGVPYDDNNNNTVRIRFRSRDDVHEAEADDDDDTVSRIQSYFWITVVVSTLMLPVVMIGIGTANMHSCPSMPSVPIFLTILGSFLMTGNLINVLFSTRYVRDLEIFTQNPDLWQMIVSGANVNIVI